MSFAFVVPAAGEGKRMQGRFPGIPKALVPIAGTPMIFHVLRSLSETGLAQRVVVVVSPAVEAPLRGALGGWDVEFALQSPPRGTGDAVRAAQAVLGDAARDIVVTFSDQPLVSAQLLVQLAAEHSRSCAAVTMATVLLPDMKGWRSAFRDWGRIIRHAGEIVDIVEARDASEKQLCINEVNPSIYCFKCPWIWNALSVIGTDNEQAEYLLTDVIKVARRDGSRIASVRVTDPSQTLGANDPDQLLTLESALRERAATEP